MFECIVHDEPYGKQRARVTKWGTYTPAKTVKKENYIKLVVAETMRKKDVKMFDGPLILEIECVFSRPKSVSEKKRPLHTVKPDLDNCIKLVNDALNKILYKDDSLIIGINSNKRYVKSGETAHIKIKVIEV